MTKTTTKPAKLTRTKMEKTTLILTAALMHGLVNGSRNPKVNVVKNPRGAVKASQLNNY